MPATKTRGQRDDEVVRVEARFTRREKALLERAAALTGRSLASFVAAGARQMAERTVEGIETIQLGAEDSEALLRALADPPQPNERLRSLARRYWLPETK